jgi:predicted MFS family arabinose efflux permease
VSIRSRFAAVVGGPARLRVVVLLAAVLALDGADKGTVSATASNLQRAFGVHNTAIGLLATVSTLVGATATIPAGALTDRICRTRLLSVAVAVWALATLAGAAAPSYRWLLLTRLALGVAVAAAGPAVASLTGDWFPADDRARMYGFILAGEMIGTGIGFVFSGLVAEWFGWRAAFAWLVLPGLLLAVVVWRQQEPERGESTTGEPAGPAAQAVEQEHVPPYPDQVLRRDPQRIGLLEAVRYVLRVRTNVVIIAASALGYFYFGGVRTFAILFAQGHYQVAKPVASLLVLVVGIGALVGVFVGGRLADSLLARGVINARVIIPAVVLFAIPLLLGPGFWVDPIWISIPLLTLGAALLGAANPPQDAARLDIIHPHLWGRSEGVRTALRQVFEAAAPVTFGWVSDHAFGSKVSTGTAAHVAGHEHGLSATFVLFLVVLWLAGAIVLIALRTYPRDVATASASLEHTS